MPNSLEGLKFAFAGHPLYRILRPVVFQMFCFSNDFLGGDNRRQARRLMLDMTDFPANLSPVSSRSFISVCVHLACRYLLYKLAYLNNLSCRAIYLVGAIESEVRKLPKSVDKVTVADIFRKTLSKHPRKTAFIFEQKTWTFQDVEDYSNRIANYFKSQGYKKGDVIALFLESCPEFICIWLGLSKVGVISALINTNLRLDSLWHCISAVDVKAIIFGTDLSGNYNFSYTTLLQRPRKKKKFISLVENTLESFK